MTYLLQASQRIERSLANLVENQKSLERVFETKLHALDIKVTEIATTVEQLKSDVENSKMSSDDDDDGTTLPTTTQFQTMPRSAAVPVPSDRATMSAPAATTADPPPVSTPPAQQTSAEAFADALLSTPSTHTGAASQRSSPPGAAGDRA